MSRLGAWLIDSDGQPKRLATNAGLLERHLENWIETNPSLLDGDIRWVSRQLKLPDLSQLDLLGLSRDGTWVIAELKAGPPSASAVRQALHYLLELEAMPNSQLGARIRSKGVIDTSVEAQLGELLDSADEASSRDYRILVAGIGEGSTADDAAAALARFGFAVPIEVISFTLLDTGFGHVLIREVDDDSVAPTTAPSSRWTLDAVIARAEHLGVAREFEAIRSELLTRGFRPSVKKTGLNFNLGSRRQVFWVQPKEGAIYIGYCAWNFADLFGVNRDEAEEELGSNWVDAPPSDALAQIQTWMNTIEGWQRAHEDP